MTEEQVLEDFRIAFSEFLKFFIEADENEKTFQAELKCRFENYNSTWAASRLFYENHFLQASMKKWAKDIGATDNQLLEIRKKVQKNINFFLSENSRA